RQTVHTSMIKAVLFDIDGVLLDSFESNFVFYQTLMQAAGYKPPAKKIYQTHFHKHMWDVIKALTGSKSKKEIKRVWQMGRDSAYRSGVLKMPSGARATVQKLSRVYPLAVVSSRIHAGIEEYFQFSKMKQYFKVAVGYEDTRRHKPHPAPLLLAAKRLRVRQEECVYIGDVESDIRAARAAGMKVIIYSKKKVGGADARTARFREIPRLVAAL
ncbi:MAG: HAD-IA family hydrolase, partial [Patescibacteria group bacterium]